MADEIQLYTQDDTGAYVEYTPPTFADSIPEGLRENEHFNEMQSVGELAERHVSTVNELTELKSAQSVPEQYEISIPDGVPKDEQGVTEFSALAKDLKLSQNQVSKIIEFDLARAKRYQEEFEKESEKSWKKHIKDGEEALKNKWGINYEENMALSSSGLARVLGTFEDGEEMEERLKKTGFLNLPDVVLLFNKIGAVTSEDVFKRGTPSPTDTVPLGPDGRPRLRYPSMGD